MAGETPEERHARHAREFAAAYEELEARHEAALAVEADEGASLREQLTPNADATPQESETAAQQELERPAPPVRGRPFAKGVSGNPHGRPLGARNKATRIAQALLEERTKSITDLLIDKALEGNMSALKLCVERILPRPRQAPASLDLTPVETISGTGVAIATLLSAMAAGELTTDEAEAIAKMVEIRRRCFESEDFKRQLDELKEEVEADRDADRRRA